MAYERNNIQRTAGYIPGEQPDDADVVKLNTNENPYPPSEKVMAALRNLPAEALRRYPNPSARPFREQAARVHSVDPDNIIATNGGDELLRLALTTFVDPGKTIGTTDPTYSLYAVLAEIHDSPVVRHARNGDWSLPDDYATRLNDAGATIAFIVNPHAPSGHLTGTDDLARVAETFNGVLVIDEAYVDFVDPAAGHNTVELIKQFDNVLILRTLSKGYALAGLRFGYGIAATSLIQPMNKAKDSYNVDAVSQALATAALSDHDAAAETWQAVRDERQRLRRELSALGLAVPPSASNFLLATVPDTVAGGARGVYESLKDQRIFVRYFDQDRLRAKLRITVGTPDQNNALLAALRPLLGGE